MTPLRQQLDELAWEGVPAEACRLAKLAAGPSRVLCNAAQDRPEDSDVAVWYQPDEGVAWVTAPSAEKLAAWCGIVRQIPFVNNSAGSSNPSAPDMTVVPWLLIKRAEHEVPVQTPVHGNASPSATGLLAMIAGQKAGLWPTAPNTLTATLGSSLLGAGLGYGAGWLGEQFLPEKHFMPGKLRRTGAILGGIAGGVPSLWYGARGGFKQDPPGTVPPPQGDSMPKEGSVHQAGIDLFDNLTHEERKLHPWLDRALRVMFKSAFADASGGLAPSPAQGAGALYLPVIDTDQFNRVVWNDPFTPPPVRAATVGMVEGASMLRGGINIVSPVDVMRIAVSAGASGYAAQVAGKVLGALAGLRPETQKTLQQIGTWSGLLTTAIPLALGVR